MKWRLVMKQNIIILLLVCLYSYTVSYNETLT